jgi:hypothetical protein
MNQHPGANNPQTATPVANLNNLAAPILRRQIAGGRRQISPGNSEDSRNTDNDGDVVMGSNDNVVMDEDGDVVMRQTDNTSLQR